MSRLLKTLPGLVLLTFLFVGCAQPDSPEQVASEFIRSVHARQFDEASSLGTPATMAAIEKTRTQAIAAPAEGKDAETLFSTNTLKAKSNATEATVENELVSLNLVKDGDEWKVVANEEQVAAILNRNQLVESAKTAWTQLKGEYEKYNAIAAEYMGSLAKPDPALTKSMEAAKTSSVDNKPAFVAAQDAFDNQLSKSMQPSQTAGSDLSLNYIIQLSTARDRIKEAKKNYNDIAARAQTKEFAPLK